MGSRLDRVARSAAFCMKTTKVPVVSALDARSLLMHGAALLDDPARPATTKSVGKLIGTLGFVQVDSIQRIERAHHLIIGTRLERYRPALLDKLAFEHRVLFEHWTHDASYIPIHLFEHWHHRFARMEQRARTTKWFSVRLGKTPEATLTTIMERIKTGGAVRASDFERGDSGPATGWWDWTPEKAALEFLWHTGKLAIAGRDRFQKVYDLVERVYPEAHPLPPSSAEAHIDWACRSALERLGVAIPSEISDFWNAISIAEAKAWCEARTALGETVALHVAAINNTKPRSAYAFADWRKRVRATPDAPKEIRLLAPFDPVIRDRDRAQRLFNFDYRFEAFVPQRKRKYGYYVLPILEGDRLIGRLDALTDRDADKLNVRRVWWEPKVKATRARQAALDLALAKLATRIGVSRAVIRKSAMK
jgi:uncharacterized protein